jgi:hypothetical protein
MTRADVTAWVRRQLKKGTAPAADIRAHALNWGLPAAECDALLGEAPPPGTAPRPVPPPRPAGGVGTEVKALLSAAGLTASGGCGCEARAELADYNGLAWCRANVPVIAGWLRGAAAKQGWAAKLAAGLALVREGWFELADPFGSVVREAIRRAAAKETDRP